MADQVNALEEPALEARRLLAEVGQLRTENDHLRRRLEYEADRCSQLEHVEARIESLLAESPEIKDWWELVEVVRGDKGIETGVEQLVSRLRAERDALAAIISEFYPWLERMGHVHVSESPRILLQASEVWDASNRAVEYLSARDIAQRRAGAVKALRDLATQFASCALTIGPLYHAGFHQCLYEVSKRADQIERGEIEV